ncbi:hypothetical protein FHX37_2796 [Haloactinospora alba]|uniref:Uncharacterized protein n=1 Tax=Haloactinospora alba TaxID=405555 RepID=A0A543NLV3_9ACTN|nr:hypothetical protein [Haloactinospora alba]TQN32813.1 hypothetical protein FHX37_2796 [Haloactinospora alba]
MVETLAPIVFFLLVAAIFATVIWMFVHTFRRDRELRGDDTAERLHRFASQRGWSYQRHGGLAPGSGLVGNSSARESTRVWDLVWGTHRGRNFRCFQHRRTSGDEDGRNTRYHRVFTVTLPDDVPDLQVTAVRWSPLWTRVRTTGDERFDRAFAVATSDERFAARVLTPELRERMLAHPPPNGVVRLGGGELTTWYKQTRAFDPESIEGVLDGLCDLLDRIPTVPAGERPE